tara:strand:+ start:3634 stop:3885 length:252 start_codon:yes stop_codon:yes gene_type:complete
MAEEIFSKEEMINGIYEGDSVSKKAQEYDACVSCGELTKYKKTDHIDYRYNYIEGFGQLCFKCSQTRKMHKQGAYENSEWSKY